MQQKNKPKYSSWTKCLSWLRVYTIKASFNTFYNTSFECNTDMFIVNPYNVGLFWRFLWLGVGRIPPTPLHNFGTITDDVMKLSTDVHHQQRNKLTSWFFWWRHYSLCDVIMFVKLWPDTVCRSKSVYSRCIAYCKMCFRFWQGKVSVYHISDGFPVIHQITRKILPGNPVKIRFF